MACVEYDLSTPPFLLYFLFNSVLQILSDSLIRRICLRHELINVWILFAEETIILHVSEPYRLTIILDANVLEKVKYIAFNERL